MDLRRRLIAHYATPIDNEAVTVNLTEFALNLILFETLIFQSIRLKEISHLIQAFGYDAVLQLLSASALELHCEALTIGQTGQLAILESRRRKGVLPWGSFSFDAISVANREEYVHDCLQPLHAIEGLSQKQVIRLKRAIISRLKQPKTSEIGNFMLEQLKLDLKSNNPTIKEAVTIALRNTIGPEIQTKFSLKVHQLSETDFTAETNISDVFDLTEEEQHRILERGMLAIGGLNQRLAEMKAYTALSGFRSADLPLFEAKLDFLTRSLSPNAQKERFKRVIAIRGFQDLELLIKQGKLSLDKLLEVRTSKECQEFREWLWSIDSIGDSEIEERIKSLREKLSGFAHGKTGKTLRWLVGTGLGFCARRICGGRRLWSAGHFRS